MQQETTEFDLQRVLSALKKRWYWLVIGLVAGLGIAVLVTSVYMPKTYAARATMYVYGVSDPDDSKGNDWGDPTEIAENCTVILTDTDVLEKVADKLNRPVPAAALQGMVSVSTVGKTNVLSVSALTTDAKLSADICNAVTEVAPDVIQQIVKKGSVETISMAKPAAAPAGPNLKKNALLGALAGLLLMALLAIVAELTDKTIKSLSDLKAHTNIPLLGEIPLMNSPKRKELNR